MRIRIATTTDTDRLRASVTLEKHRMRLNNLPAMQGMAVLPFFLIHSCTR
jgi:hypothetical protein